MPSYFRRRVEALRSLETISQEVLNSTKAEIMNAMPEQQILNHIQLKDAYSSADRGYLPIKGRGKRRAFLLADASL